MNRISAALLTTVFALTACEQKDKTPPPAPVVDPITSPTPLASVSVTGSAEFGSTINITGGAESVTTKADPFTARWRATVKLTANADNTLSVTATDAAGNVSDATTAVVTQSASKPTSIKLSLGSPAVKAGEQVALVTRVLDQYGNEMADAPVTFASSPSLAASFTIPGTSPAVTKDQGVLAQTHQFVAYDLSGVKSSGYTFQITATSGTATDTQVLTVRPAPAQSFSKLAYSGGAGADGGVGGTRVSLQAGQDAAYAYEVIDLYGNVTTGPVSAFTNAPGAIVLDDGVSGSGKVTRLTTVGSFSIAFYIAGVGQKGSLSVDVGTAPGAFVDVSASATLASPQTAVKVFARVRDAYGNVILCSTTNTGAIAFTAQGTTAGTVAPAATTCFNGSFQTSFTFAAEDNYAITATYQPTGATTVAGNVFVTVLNFDNTPPQVSIQNITVNGTPCTPASRPSAAGCDVANGDQVEFDAVATDNQALAEVAYTIFFTSTQANRTRTVFIAANQPSATVHFRFGVNSNAIETAPLVAMAVDRAGNIQNSQAVNFFVNFGVPVGNRTLSTVTTGVNLNQPQDLAFDSAGNLFILNRGNNNVLKLPSGSSSASVYSTNVRGNFITHASLTGGGERMYLSDRANGNGIVYSFDPTAAMALTTFVNMGGVGLASGVGMLNATPARGWFDVTTAATGDQARLTNGTTTVSYQFDSTGTCAAGTNLFCVAFTAGATGAQKATALAGAINGNASSLVTAVANGARVDLASKAMGEPTLANTITLSHSGVNITQSSPQLAESHDSNLYAGNDGDTFVRRYNPASGPYTGGAAGTSQAQFDVLVTQWGLSVRDTWTSPSDNLFDTTTYFVDANPGIGNMIRLRAYRTTVTGTGVGTNTATNPVFAVNQSTIPQVVGFQGLWDTVVTPSGCVLVSDEQGGNIFAIDARNPATTNPTVELVARALPGPRGLALDSTGNLYIAENAGNAVLKLTPAGGSSCF